MPEIIEVYFTARYLNHYLKNKYIESFKPIGKGRYTKYDLKNLSLLPGCKILSVNSKGKFLWYELKDPTQSLYIFNTFGLTGYYSVTKTKYSGIKIKLSNNFIIYWNDKLNFGTFEITPNLASLSTKLASLGPDLLQTNFSGAEFYQRIVSLKKNDIEIVKVLTNQKSPLGSGIGNYLIAEILYQAKISPFTKIIEFKKSHALSYKLATAIKYVIKDISLNSDLEYYLDPTIIKYIAHIRKKLNIHPDTYVPTISRPNFLVYGQNTDPLGNKVIKSKILKTQTTYWTPDIQK